MFENINNMMVKIMKKNLKEYNKKNKDKLREYRKEYYKKKKEARRKAFLNARVW